MGVENIPQMIKDGDVLGLKDIMEKENLIIKDGKIIAEDKDKADELSDYYDIIQMAKKILQNSLYGGITNPASNFFDQRMGQSCTLTGRATNQHQGKKINELITGKYELGEAVVYGDSVDGSSIIRTSVGEMTIEELYDRSINPVYHDSGKEYAFPDDIKIVGFMENHTPMYTDYNFIMRHRTSKEKWKISTSTTNVIVTNDHSIMVYRENDIVEVKPSDLCISDILIKLVVNGKTLTSEHEPLVDITHMGNFENEYVYDISVKDNPTVFFANDVLVKNTDSIYFTIPNSEDINKDNFIEIADQIGIQTNSTFSEFYKNMFNVPTHQSHVIKSAREICATTGLFIKKKKYTAIVYDEKGFRHDVNKAGKLKVMGLDIKRADCPEWVQDKLQDTLNILLSENKSIDDILEFIQDWRQEFVEFEPWKMGIPKRVNKLTYYNQMFLTKAKGITIPGHVRASINWNHMLDQLHDRNSTRISDGGKVIVCKLKKNKYNMDSIAYPIDQSNLPDWFKQLPFDNDMMVEVAVDQKVKNIFGILGWDLEITKRPKQFSTFFSME